MRPLINLYSSKPLAVRCSASQICNAGNHNYSKPHFKPITDRMKKLLLLFAICILQTTAFAQLTSGLVAHWPFNGNAQDVAGIHHGIPNNITWGTGVLGTPNSTAHFIGNNTSLITVSHQNDLNISKNSICAIVKFDSFYRGTCQGNRLLTRGEGSGAGNYFLELYDNAYDSVCTVNGDTNNFTFHPFVSGNPQYAKPGQYAPTTRTRNWYCVVTTWNDTVYKVYINGVLKTTWPAFSTSAPGTSTDSLIIGGMKYGNTTTYPYPLAGDLDEMRLYNRVLNITEIDSFCSLFHLTDSSVYVQQGSSTNKCTGDTINIQYVVNTPFQAGNIFTLQLSNAAGSFGTPVNIGSVTATTSGTITGTIPAGTTPGTGYRLRVVASNPGKTSDPTITNLTIGTRPANLVANSNWNVCQNGTIQLTGTFTGSGTYTYSWTGPNSFAASTLFATVLNAPLSAAGVYTLTVSNNGCASTDTAQVAIIAAPAKPTASTNAPICEGLSLTLNAATVANVTYGWTGPNGYTSSTQNNVRSSATSAMSGIYVVTATSTTTGCKSTDTLNVTVKPLPANVSAGNNGPICAGGALSLNGNTSSSGTTWSWTGPGGFTSTLQNPFITSVTTAASGTYNAIVTLNGCSSSASTTVVVNAVPATPAASANTPVCTGQTLNLTASTVSGASYIWTGPSSFSSTLQNPSITSANTTHAGTYTVRSSANGCQSAPATVVVTVTAAPTVFAYPSPKDSICVGGSITLNASITGVTAPTYQWYQNGNLIPGATSKVYTTSAVSDYDVFYCGVNITSLCATAYTANSAPITVRVLPYMSPLVSIVSNPPAGTTVSSGTMINFTASPVNAGNKPKYQWTRNGKDIVGATSNLWGATTLSNHDTICVKIISDYLCPDPQGAISNCIVVSIESISNGVNNTSTGNKLMVFPNPSNGSFTLQGKWNTNGKVQATVTNAVGQVIYKESMPVNNGMLNNSIKLSNVAAGIYTLRLQSDSEYATVKLTIE